VGEEEKGGSLVFKNVDFGIVFGAGSSSVEEGHALHFRPSEGLLKTRTKTKKRHRTLWGFTVLKELERRRS